MAICNEDCIEGAKKIGTACIDLIICDPPFGISEGKFDKHYKRNASKVIQGYVEAPDNYAEWTKLWMTEAARILKSTGTFYVVIGHSNLRHVLNSGAELGLFELNHLIWKYQFGVYTKNKFVTSHYHIIRYAKTENPLFNTYCRFGSQEKSATGKSLLYMDLEDVFQINKDYAPNETKNINKLPEELIQKLVLYSSNPGDSVCDFFMGNFTTAYVAHGLGRHVSGFEINKEAYDYHMTELAKVSLGSRLETLKKVENIEPENRGKPISEEEIKNICQDYLDMSQQNKLKKEISKILQEKYQRGPFAIKNILDANLSKFLTLTRSA